MAWIVTTASRPSDGEKSRAAALAESLGLGYLPRGKRTLSKISRSRDGAPILIVDDRRGLRARTPKGLLWGWHPGLAKIRIPSARLGKPDHLVRSMEPREGMRILDANLGLAHDALVMASRGASVTGLEVDAVIHAITADGLSRAPEGDLPLPIRDASRRISPLCADQAAYLENAGDDAFDGILFSPMFVQPDFVADDMLPLRELAPKGWPSGETLADALRVAPRVVVKVERGRHPPLPEPARWNHGGRSRVAYAVYER